MSHQTKPFAWPPLLLIALALALNLHALAGDSFWGDEILTASFASRSPAEVIRWTATDIHPPLYYLIAGIFTKLMIPLGATPDPGPVTDWLWRFPSVIAVVLTIAVTYRLASRFTIYDLRFTIYDLRITYHVSRITPPIAALLLALSPIAIKYGQEARMHALFMALSALATLLLFRALSRPDRWRRWLAFALVTTANIYTMYFGFLILAAHTALVGFTIFDFRLPHLPIAPPANHQIAKSPNLLLTRFTLTTLLALFLYLPWWPVLFDILRRRAAVGAIEGGVGDPLTFVTGVIRALGPSPTPVAWLFLALFITGLIFLARRRWPLAAFGALWLILPAALPLLLGDPRALQFRYAFILPLYLTIIAHAIVSLSIFVTTGAGHRPAQNTTPTSPSPHLSISPSLKPPTPPQPSNLPSFQFSTRSTSLRTSLPTYFTWLLATLSFIATLTFYAQTKPNWRGAAAHLDERAKPVDIILIGPLWDEGRFIDYYYRGQARLLTPAALVANIQGYADSLRSNGGRVWAVNRFAPTEMAVLENFDFSGVVISGPTVPVYEPELLTAAAIDLANQAVTGAYPWAEAADAQGVLNPDPRTAQAAALRALGDTLVAAGQPQAALEPYQTAVDIFPGWVNGFLVLAETQERLGNLPAAAEAYQQAVAFNLAWHGPPADEAARLVEREEWQAAIKKYHQIIE